MREASLLTFPIEFSNLRKIINTLLIKFQMNFKKRSKEMKNKAIVIINKTSHCKLSN